MHGSPVVGLPVKRVRFSFKYIDWGNVPSPEIPDNTMNVFKAFFKKL